MKRLVLATLATLALAGCGPEPSFASLHSPWFARADAIAAAYWHAEPACPAAERTWEVMSLTQGIVASAENQGCRRKIALETLRSVPFFQFCDASAHEYGHLLGFGHTGDVKFVNGASMNGPTPEQDPLHIMDPYGAELPGCHAYRPHGRTRNKKRSNDRRWCAKNPEICIRKYPNLASASLTR